MCLWIIFHSTDSVCPSLQHLKRWFHIFLFRMHTHSSSPLSRRQIIWSCLLHPSAVRWYSPLPYSAVSLSLGGGGFTLWFYFSPPLLLLLLWPIWQAAATKTDVSNRHTQTHECVFERVKNDVVRVHRECSDVQVCISGVTKCSCDGNNSWSKSWAETRCFALYTDVRSGLKEL